MPKASKMQALAWLFTALTAHCDILQAQDEELSLDQLFKLKIEVSSSTPDTIFNSPSSVSVIDRFTIKKYNFRTISEAIETLAGVSVNRTFFAQNVPSIRGILQDNYVNRLLILIDGVPAWMSITGDGEVERINVNDLERIEVLKGPASVLYGTNAYSGAINLVLRKAEDESEEDMVGEFRVSNGFLSKMQSTNAHLFYSDDKMQYYIAGSGQSQKGFEYPGKNADGKKGYFKDENGGYLYHKDYQNRSNVTGKLQYKTGFGVHTLLLNSYQNEVSYLGAKPTISQGAGHPYDSSGRLASYSFSLPLGKSSMSASVTYDANEREFSRKNDNRVKGRLEGSRMSSRAQSSIFLTDWANLEVGADYDQRTSRKFEIFDPLDQQVFQDNEMSNRSVDENSVFVQLGIKGEQLNKNLPVRLLVGARQTNNETFDSNTSMRSTLVYNVSATSSLKFVYGQSYRAPTLFELYYKDSAATNEIFGNAELQPEKSTSIELAYLVAPTRHLFLQALVFKGEFEDKIVRVRRYPNNTNDLSLTFANGNRFEASGTEWEIKYLNPNIANILLSMSAINGNDGDKVDDKWTYKFVPKQSGSLAINRGFDNISASVVGTYLGERGGGNETIKADALVDAGINYQAEAGTHSVQVKNIADKQREYPEYIRGILNSLSSGQGREVIYEFSTAF